MTPPRLEQKDQKYENITNVIFKFYPTTNASVALGIIWILVNIPNCNNDEDELVIKPMNKFHIRNNLKKIHHNKE